LDQVSQMTLILQVRHPVLWLYTYLSKPQQGPFLYSLIQPTNSFVEVYITVNIKNFQSQFPLNVKLRSFTKYAIFDQDKNDISYQWSAFKLSIVMILLHRFGMTDPVLSVGIAKFWCYMHICIVLFFLCHHTEHTSQ